MADAMVPIGKVVLNSAQASVVFAGLPQTFRDLRLVVVGNNSSTSSQDFGIRFNSDSATNYSRMYISGISTGAVTGGSSTDSYSVCLYVAPSTSQCVLTADMFDYTQTDKHKIVLARNDNPGNQSATVTSRWASTAAITSITCMTLSGANWSSGTVLELFGVLA